MSLQGKMVNSNMFIVDSIPIPKAEIQTQQMKKRLRNVTRLVSFGKTPGRTIRQLYHARVRHLTRLTLFR